MKFQYHNPVKFVFGTDSFGQIPDICKGHKVMLVYGGGSTKANGVYGSITKILKENEIPYIDYGNHTGAAHQVSYPASFYGSIRYRPFFG